MKEIVKLGLMLFLISAVAAAALGYVNAATKEPIEDSKRVEETKTRKILLTEADSFEELAVQNSDQYPIVSEIYKGTKGDDLCGYIFKTIPKGYGGQVEVLTGITLDGTIAGVDIGSNNETPGLGAKASENQFKGQYKGKGTLLNVIKSGTPKEDEISAISGATITSEAVTGGVNEALSYFKDNLNNGN